MCDTLIFWLNIVFGFNPLFEFIFVVTSVSLKRFCIGWHNDEVSFFIRQRLQKTNHCTLVLDYKGPI